jgi:hypothetical protein
MKHHPRSTTRSTTAPNATQKRTSAEWGDLVAEWRASGKTGAAFAAERGIKPGTLAWWAWRLRARDGASARCKTPSRLLPVRVVAEPTVTPTFAASANGWELTTVRGDVLRVHGALDTHSLSSVLTAITAPGRTRRR